MNAVELPLTPSLPPRRQARAGDRRGRGLGLAFAAALAEAGAHVTLAARTAEEIEAAAEAIRAARRPRRPAPLDVTDIDGAGRTLDATEAFDIFVNNAGTNRPKPFVEVSAEDYDAVMGLNVRAAFFAAQAVARRMIAAGRGGSIINVSSQMGHVGAAEPHDLLRVEACAGGPDQGDGGRTRAARHPRQHLGPTFIETPMTRPSSRTRPFATACSPRSSSAASAGSRT